MQALVVAEESLLLVEVVYSSDVYGKGQEVDSEPAQPDVDSSLERSMPLLPTYGRQPCYFSNPTMRDVPSWRPAMELHSLYATECLLRNPRNVGPHGVVYVSLVATTLRDQKSEGSPG